ncbi:MAG: ParB/RepB/Spo0J family partition protein [Sphingomonadaceae bacterium]|nr:ParB/RepB/Spo0J family partition protein [Sphingomonadaceae bacterium]
MADDKEKGEAKGPESGQIAPLGGLVRAKRPGGLGRGLSALLGDMEGEAPLAATISGGAPREGLTNLPIAQIHPHPDQPRRHFDEGALTELAASIRTRGLVQPILVRPAPDGQGWQLVAGERRWRAAQRAGLHEVPALVRSLDDRETFTIALVENIQRKDLTAIEEAEAYARLRDNLGHNAEEIGQMTGKSRSHVTNILRLLDLPDGVRAMVADGSLGMGHARALIGHADALGIARKAAKQGWSVRKVEALVRQDGTSRRAASGRTAARTNGGDSGGDADIAALESHLAALLGVAVRINYNADGSGQLTLDYASLDTLDMLCQRLSGGQF